MSIFDELKIMLNGKEEDLEKINNSNLFLLNKWLSFNKNNVKACGFIERVMFYVDPEIIKWTIFHNIDRKNRSFKWLKKAKDNDEFMKNYLCSCFKISKRELNEIWPLLKPKLQKGTFCTQLGYYFNGG